jgi:hypothetical protein
MSNIESRPFNKISLIKNKDTVAVRNCGCDSCSGDGACECCMCGGEGDGALKVDTKMGERKQMAQNEVVAVCGCCNGDGDCGSDDHCDNGALETDVKMSHPKQNNKAA